MEFEEGCSLSEKYRDWYEGFALRQLPSINNGQFNYSVKTSAINGSFNTLNFNDEYRKYYQKYKNGQARIWYKDHIDKQYKRYKNVWFQLYVDIQNHAKINVKTLFDTMEITSKDGQGNSVSRVSMRYNDSTTYEMYSNIGSKEVIKTFLSNVYIQYDQKISDDVISYWGNKRGLGMQVSWEVPLGQSNQGPKYSSELPNVVYRKLVNILQKGIKPKAVWDVAKKIRIDWLSENDFKYENLVSNCVLSDNILSKKRQELFMSKVITKLGINEDNLDRIGRMVKDENLKLAAEVQLYLTNCPSKEWMEKLNFLTSLISTASPRMLLATTNGLITKAIELEKEIEAEAFTEFLDKLTEVFKLQHKQIEFFMKKGAKKSWLGINYSIS